MNSGGLEGVAAVGAGGGLAAGLDPLLDTGFDLGIALMLDV